MRTAAFSILAAIVVATAVTSPAHAVGYCPPEYQSCEGVGTPGGTWGGSSTGTAPRDGDKKYGTNYEECTVVYALSPTSRCWECVYNLDKRTNVCGGVRHTASCGCTETYSNYILVDCQIYGYCEYHY